MWSLIKFKNKKKAIFPTLNLKVSKDKTQVNIAGLDISCTILKNSDNMTVLQDGLVKTPEIFREARVSINTSIDDITVLQDGLVKTPEVSREAGVLMNTNNDSPGSQETQISKNDSNMVVDKDSHNGIDDNGIGHLEELDKAPITSMSLLENTKPDILDKIEKNSAALDSTYSDNEKNPHSIENSLTDPEYIPDSSANTNKDHVKSQDEVNSKSTAESITMEEPILLPVSEDGTGKEKKYYCQFCKKRFYKYARHLEMIHSKEDEVKDFLKYEKNSQERRDKITLLRNESALLWNKIVKENGGELQVPRQQSKGLNKTSKSLEICRNCNGMFSCKSIKSHRCPAVVKPTNSTKREGKMLNRQKFLHCKSGLSERMRMDILPTLRQNPISEIIMNDDLILQYGEHKCRHLPQKHNNNYIKSQMMYAAKILDISRGLDKSITSMSSLLCSKKYDVIISAILNIAKWDEEKFKSPTVATNLTTIIIQLTDRYEVMLIKSSDEVLKATELPIVKEFQSLITKEFTGDINKIAMINYTKNKSAKPLKKLSDQDLQIFYDYITNEKDSYAKKVKKSYKKQKFNADDWLRLLETVLLEVISFNSKRVGEAQRILIEDFKKAQKITEDHPAWNELTEEEKNQAHIYTRFVITGKLYNAVPVLLDDHLVECFDLIISLRERAGVRTSNPFVFGIPNQNDRVNKTPDACQLFRKYAPLCGVKDHTLLRGTLIRKHLATKVLNEGADSNKVESTAKFMGHAAKIHKGIYQGREVEDITRISTVLEKSCGKKVLQSRNSQDSITSLDSAPESSSYETRGAKKKSLKRPRVDLNKSSTSQDSAPESSSYKTRGAKKKSRKRPRVDLYKSSTSQDSDPEECTPYKTLKLKKIKRNLFVQNDKENKCKTKCNDHRLSNQSSFTENDSSEVEEKNRPETKVSRPRWSEEDIKLLCAKFHGAILSKKPPSNEAMRRFQEQNQSFQNRNLNSIRTFITRIISNKEKFAKYLP